LFYEYGIIPLPSLGFMASDGMRIYLQTIKIFIGFTFEIA
jgi:hypothetical protein